MTIAEVKPGQKGVIERWLDGAPPARLLEFGLLPGTLIELVRFAPFGDPVEIKVRGYHLSIRLQEASQILLKDEFLA